MAQTVKVEIPIEATDNTGKGVSSAERRLTSLERSMAKMEKQLERLDKKHDINIDANDHASEKVDSVEGDVDKLNGASANVDVDANDHATDIINGALSSVNELDGSDAEADLEANDMATDIIEGAMDAVDQFDAAEGTAEIEADDMATDVIQGAENEAETFGGMSETATIGVDDQASDVIENVRGKAESWANSTFMATMGILGASVGVADTIDTYKDFQSTMSEVEAISGATANQMYDLTESAKAYGSTTKFTATEAGEAFKYMAMAGWKVTDMQAGIGGILNLAAAAGEDLGTTSDIVTDALTAFGYGANQATRFSDVLAAASSNSNTNVAMMGETFKYVGTMAGTLGYDIEDVAVAAGAMANAGIKSSMAGTSLNTILTRLSTNTNGARDAIEDLGVSFFKQDGSARPLIDVMNDLRAATADMTTEEQTAFAKTVAGTTAQKGLNAILNASEEDWLKLSDAIYNADGAAGRMADTMMDNLAGSITLFNSALEGVKDTLGERTEPYLRSAIDGLTEMLPGASEKINGFMNNFDRTIEKMKLSEKWKNGSFLDKVNIAWDTVIGYPFKKWIGGKGKSMISGGISGLFTEAMKILPGGQEAGLTSWLSAGLLGVGTAKLIGGVGSLASTVSGLGAAGTTLGAIGSTIGGLIPYAAAATAAIIALGVAIDAINQKQIKNSLATHFGDISLTAAQVEAVAGQVLDAKWAVNIKLAVGELEGADELRATAEKAIMDNKALEYKNSVGIELTADEQSAYKSNVETFVQSKVDELSKRTYSAKIMVDTMLQTAEGESLSAAISAWTLEDTLALDGLSAQMTEAVDAALSDGIISVDEAGHIAELQSKINNIVGQWKQAESQAAMDVINQKYGELSGQDLTADSYSAVIESLRSQRETNTAYLDSASQEFYTMLHAMENSGRLGQLGLDFDIMQKQWVAATRNAEAMSLANSVNFEHSTLNGTYGDLLSSNMASNATTAQNAVNYANDSYKSGTADMYSVLTAQASNLQTYSGFMASGDQKALAQLYSQMKPDVTAMGELIDAARQSGEAVPRSFMESYNNALQMGAASGDMDAAWGVYANQLLESGDKALVDGIKNGTVAAPEELRTALERAMTEVTDDPIEMDDVTAKIDGAEVTEDSAEAIKESIQNFLDTVDASGSTAEVTADGIQVSLGEVEVDGQSAAAQIAEAIGITVEELASYNGYTVQEIEAGGVTVKIPTDGVTVNAEGLAEAIAAKTKEATSGVGGGDNTVESTTTVNQTMEDGTVTDNTSTADLADPDPVDQTVTVNTTYTKGTDNIADITSEAQTDLNTAFATNFPVSGNVDVTLSRASDNIAEIYSGVQSSLNSTFATGFSVSAPVSIHLNYSISNPSASISLGGSASGSGTVTASVHSNATGNKISGKILSWLGEEGPEYVIPTTGRYKQRGRDLWMAAGEDLGMFDDISQNADGSYADGDQEINNPFVTDDADKNIWTTAGNPQESTDTSSGESRPVSVIATGGGNEGGKGNEINVVLNPTIQIDSGEADEEKIFEIIKSRIRELGDDIADEIATQMAKVYDNMPLGQGA